jgi:hypothetical protein
MANSSGAQKGGSNSGQGGRGPTKLPSKKMTTVKGAAIKGQTSKK